MLYCASLLEPGPTVEITRDTPKSPISAGEQFRLYCTACVESWPCLEHQLRSNLSMMLPTPTYPRVFQNNFDDETPGPEGQTPA